MPFQGSKVDSGEKGLTFRDMDDLPMKRIVTVDARVVSIGAAKSCKGPSDYYRTVRLTDRSGNESAVNLFGGQVLRIVEGKCYTFKNFEKTYFKGKNDQHHWLGKTLSSEVSEVDGW